MGGVPDRIGKHTASGRLIVGPVKFSYSAGRHKQHRVVVAVGVEISTRCLAGLKNLLCRIKHPWCSQLSLIIQPLCKRLQSAAPCLTSLLCSVWLLTLLLRYYANHEPRQCPLTSSSYYRWLFLSHCAFVNCKLYSRLNLDRPWTSQWPVNLPWAPFLLAEHSNKVHSKLHLGQPRFTTTNSRMLAFGLCWRNSSTFSAIDPTVMWVAALPIFARAWSEQEIQLLSELNEGKQFWTCSLQNHQIYNSTAPNYSSGQVVAGTFKTWWNLYKSIRIQNCSLEKCKAGTMFQTSDLKRASSEHVLKRSSNSEFVNMMTYLFLEMWAYV